MAENKKNIMTYEGLKALEDELQDLKVNRRREVAQKIKEAVHQALARIGDPEKSETFGEEEEQCS